MVLLCCLTKPISVEPALALAGDNDELHWSHVGTLRASHAHFIVILGIPLPSRN